MKTKYIVFKDFDTDMEEMLVFGATMMHCDVASWVRGKVISAGFLYIGFAHEDGKVYAYDRSESLNLDSRPEKDTKIAERVLFGRY